MGRKIYHKIRIESIENQISLWELRGQNEMGHGLRLFFRDVISDANIEARKVELAQANGIDYTPKPELLTAARGKTHQYTEGATWEETRTVRNRKNGRSYKYHCQIAIEGGKRKIKYLNRAGG